MSSTATAPTEKKLKILFLCTGNSARSILAEYLIRRLAPGKFDSFSAGAHPKGTVNPFTLRILKDQYKIDASDARSKSWDEFKAQDFDFIITVCDDAKETCPVWPSQPIVAHWGVPDPVAAPGNEVEQYRAFLNTALLLYRRLDIFVNLPLGKLDKLRLQELTKSIGTSGRNGI